MQMTCPKCRGEMRTYERSGVTVDQCTECRGIFLDRGELEKLFEAEANWNQQQPAAQRPPAAAPGGYPPPPPGGYAPPPPPPAPAHGYPAPAPAYGSHGQQHYGYHGHYRRKKHKGFLGELFD
jgi:Zn-finger nucleic acid-binding protein